MAEEKLTAVDFPEDLYTIVKNLENSDEELKKMLGLSHAQDLLNGKFSDIKFLEKVSVEDLEKTIITSAYLNINSEKIIEEFIWKLGEKREDFEKYFLLLQRGKGRLLASSAEWEIRKDIHKIIYDSLNLYVLKQDKKFVKTTLEFISVRFEIPNMHNCLDAGNLRLLEWMYENMDKVFWDHQKYCCRLAAAKSVKCLKFMVSKGCTIDEKTCEAAARSGNLESLKFLIDTSKCAYDKMSLSSNATMSENFECIKYVVEKGCLPNTTCCKVMCAKGDVKILEYLYETIAEKFDSIVFTQELCNEAASYGRFDCLKFLVEKGVKFNSHTIERTITADNFESFKYLLEKMSDDQKFYVRTCDQAEFSIYCYGPDMHIKACKKRYLTEIAASIGRLKILKYLHEIGCEWDAKTTLAASAGNHLECLTYALSNGCPIIPLECLKVAERYGKCQRTVKYLKEQFGV